MKLLSLLVFTISLFGQSTGLPTASTFAVTITPEKVFAGIDSAPTFGPEVWLFGKADAPVTQFTAYEIVVRVTLVASDGKTQRILEYSQPVYDALTPAWVRMAPIYPLPGETVQAVSGNIRATGEPKLGVVVK